MLEKSHVVHFIIASLLLMSLTGCVVEVSTISPDPTSSPATVLETATAKVVVRASPTSDPTSTLTPEPTITSSPQPTLDPVTFKELLPDGLECSTPKSLMLHSAFGSRRMEELAQRIIERGWHTTTYRSMLDDLQQGICPSEDTLIVSLDDLGTSWLRLDFIDMVEVFIKHELVLVLGVVSDGPQDPEIWDLLKTWEEQGMEIASHTMSHYILPLLSDEELTKQVSGSYDIICENLGVCPVTLVLTFGEGGDDPRVIEAAHEYIFMIGIEGGHSFGESLPFYLGRIPPNNDDQSLTLNLLENTFKPQESE
jgi:peptidoglycan/xylan/chitin deacetylase (PgdA/CDA1 family)